jgi:hypothetical protein
MKKESVKLIIFSSILLSLIIIAIILTLNIALKVDRAYNNVVKINIKNPTNTDYYICVTPVDLNGKNKTLNCIQDKHIIPHQAFSLEEDIHTYCGDYPDFKNILIVVLGWKTSKDKQGKYSKSNYAQPDFMKTFYHPEFDFHGDTYKYLYFGYISIVDDGKEVQYLSSDAKIR